MAQGWRLNEIDEMDVEWFFECIIRSITSDSLKDAPRAYIDDVL